MNIIKYVNDIIGDILEDIRTSFNGNFNTSWPVRNYFFLIFCIFYIVLFVNLFLQRKEIESKKILCLFFGSVVITFIGLAMFSIPAARLGAVCSMVLLVIYLKCKK